MKKTFAVSLAVIAGVAFGEIQDRPTGYKIGQRMTLKPYVSFYYTWDSNGDQQNDAESRSSWVVNPGLDLTYKAENWQLSASAFYRYTAYNNYANQLNEHSYGESINYSWANAAPNEKGWSLLLTEKYQKINENDDMTSSNGRGLWRDRQELDVSGAVQRRFTDKFHGDFNANYHFLDYVNDPERYAALYGWQRWMFGLETGYAATKWTDFILAANYQRYYQDNSSDRTGYSRVYGTSGDYSRESDGWTVMGGISSYATERISYRALVGWSHFEYADSDSADTVVYSVSGNWKIGDTWNTMLLAESYYRPSESQYGTLDRVDNISLGVAKSMVRGKLNGTIDVSFRKETAVLSDQSTFDDDENFLSARLGLNYIINRFATVFGRVEYQGCWYDGNTGSVDRDYDRFRLSVGFTLTY